MGLPQGYFPPQHPITKDGRIFMVSAPEHYVGHLAVIVRDDGTYLFFGDAGYTLEDMMAGYADGVEGGGGYSAALRASP